MDKYKFLKKGLFESLEKFQTRINEQARKGYKAISMAKESNGYMVVLFERLEH
jgi:hypothetical protein